MGESPDKTLTLVKGAVFSFSASSLSMKLVKASLVPKLASFQDELLSFAAQGAKLHTVQSA